MIDLARNGKIGAAKRGISVLASCEDIEKAYKYRKRA
jgi:hypothetical protein